jgi:hypothetical protein
MRLRQECLLLSSVALVFTCLQPAMASDRGSLIVRVSPKETYIYADGEPVYESKGHYITLEPGEHKIDLYNYGYRPETRTVTITSHQTTKIDVTMQAIPGAISGPWGCITIEGPHGAAILLNGKDPHDYFVGNIKEFDNDHLWHKELIVPPGKQELTVAYAQREPWTTTVDVEPNKRVVVDAFKGVRKTVPWSRGEQIKELSRFQGGILNDHVAVEKVGGQFASSSGQVNCGDSAHLTWSSTGATKTEINGTPVSASGDETVQPKQNTNYKFTAAGPGGVYTSEASVNVNNDIPATLTVTPASLTIQNSGQGEPAAKTATVTWSAPNANSVSVDPLGSVGESGSREVPVSPNTSAGPIDQTVTYTLTATNACGGSQTRTASLHITGSNGPLEGAVNAPSESQGQPTQVAQAAPAQLPHTASQLPLIGLVGILFLAAAASLRLIVKKMSV